MVTLLKPLAAQTADELMNDELLLLTEDMSLRDAARFLAQHAVSGAPVVNREGQLAGVLSSTDFVRVASQASGEVKAAEAPLSCHYQRELNGEGKKIIECTLPMGACGAQRMCTDSAGIEHVMCLEPRCVFVDWQNVEVESLPADQVGRFMSRVVVTASVGTPVKELARRMVNAHVHRVIVVNHANEPVGIVTSTDILSAVARMDA